MSATTADVQNKENNCLMKSGLSTIGLRSSKYTPVEWRNHYVQKFNHSAIECENAETLRQDSKTVVRDAEAIIRKFQSLSTQKLKERLHDTSFWKQELEREITDIITETNFLVAEKRRLENALMESDFPLQIVTENINTRDYRRGVDRVADEVETELLMELEIIQNVQTLLKKAIEQAERQIVQNRAAKEALELNWSDKKEAVELDNTAAKLTNTSTNKQFYAGVVLYQENMSDPETWAKAANEVITQCEAERVASADLRTIIAELLVDTARDMRQQHDKVNAAFQRNLNNLICTKSNLEDHLKKVLDEISLLEKDLGELKAAVRLKDDPLKVAQTRLHLRSFRPNLDLCKDAAATSLVDEVGILSTSLDVLLQQYADVENKLKDLHDVQMMLEKEIELKQETINIDQVRCIPRRSAYPSALRLQGFTQ